MKKLLIVPILALALTACVKDNIGEKPIEQTPSSKIHFADAESAPGRLLVKVDAPIDEFMADGIDLDIKPLFPASDNTSLDCWLMVRFDESLDSKAVAEAIAKDSHVVRIEYDVKMRRIEGKRVAMPTSRPEKTRATTLPFNDPELE